MNQPWLCVVLYFVNLVLSLLNVPVVAVCAIFGKYPWWMLTPDDLVSPFGLYEPSQKRLYEKYGRWVGDFVWLAWRNSLYGLAYAMKPAWLKEVTDYLQLNVWKEGNRVFLECPDGRVLVETTCKWGPLYVITGHRLSPILAGKHEAEEELRVAGRIVNPHPFNKINMDGRPICTIRLKSTL